MSKPYQSFNPEEQRTMSKHVNQMLEVVKDMSKSIARMQDLWDQMIEVLDKQSNINFGNLRTFKSSRIPRNFKESK